MLGEEQVALTTAWAGYRWGPVGLHGDGLRVLPHTRPFDSRAETPRPVGLVGVNRSPRLGAGIEFADIRPFRTGDRLRRISWRVSVRSRELHVTTSPAEEDSGVLLVVDALGDHGNSEGLDGEASSLDQSVRAAAAVAEHHIRAGDRVGLRIVGGEGGLLGYGAGTRHLRALLDLLAGVRAGELPDGIAERIKLRVRGGSVVFVLSPMLGATIVTATASLVQRGLPVIVIDTLPPDAEPRVPDGVDPQLAHLAWRMRRLERDQVLAGLGALGCPVVAMARPGHRRRRAAPAGPPRQRAARPAGVGGGVAVNLLVRESRPRLLLRAVILVAPGPGPVGCPPDRPPARLVRGAHARPLGRLRGDAGVGAGHGVPGRWWSSGGPWPLPTAYQSVRSRPRSSCWPPMSPRCCSPTGHPGSRSAPSCSRRWLRRGAGVAVAAPLVWLVAVVVDDQPEPPGIWISGLACAVVVCIVAAAAVTCARTRRDHPDPEEYVELVLSIVEADPAGPGHVVRRDRGARRR